MPEKNPAQRSDYWDNAKGLLITLVVLGHYLYAYHNSKDLNLAGAIVGIIYVFHMPAFIFISGFFSRSENARKSETLIKLAVAYVIFNFSMMGFSFLLSGVKISLLTPYYSYWYILVIIIWRLCINSLNRVKGIVFISISVALLIGFMSEFTNILAVGRLVAFFPFFLLGYRLNPEKIQKFINGRKSFVKLSGFILSAFSIYIAYMATKLFDISQTDFLMGEYKDVKDIIVRLVIFFVSALVILCLGLAIPVKKLPMLAKWGKNSLTIYLCHRIFTVIFAEIFPARQYNAYYLIFALMATAATLFLFGTDYVSNLLNKVLGKLTGILTGERENSDARSLRLLQSGIALCLVGILTLSAAQMFYTSKTQTSNENAALTDNMYPVFQSQVSTNDKKRVEEVHALITKVMFGEQNLTLDQLRERYFLFKDGYARERTTPMTITPQQKTGSLYMKLANSTSVCFTGDSVTQGNKNGGYGWYEPMAAAFPALTVYKQAWGGATTKILLDNADLLAGCKADLYVVAIGTNDVRYRDEKICAMDSTAYVNNLKALTERILAANPKATFVFVSPWPALENDTVTKLPVEQRDSMLAEYTAALKEFCNAQGHIFVDPATELKRILNLFPPSDYLIDYIHPNANKGLTLYSGAVLSY